MYVIQYMHICMYAIVYTDLYEDTKFQRLNFFDRKEWQNQAGGDRSFLRDKVAYIKYYQLITGSVK